VKLDWYERGGRVSERQYRDVLGVIAVQTEAGTFDAARLRSLAAPLGLTELVDQALTDASTDMESGKGLLPKR
jgi:hypothetical protein